MRQQLLWRVDTWDGRLGWATGDALEALQPHEHPGRAMDAWHEFHATGGAASAAPVGLLFVGISIREATGGGAALPEPAGR